ncbi:MAG: N-acetyltransferase family protein [Halieaceae bacterium]
MIRPAQPSDSQALADLYNYYVLNSVTTFESEPISGDEMGSRVDEVQQLGLPWIVVEAKAEAKAKAEDDAVVCGYACAVRWKQRAAYQHSVESTVYLAEGYSGRGLGIAIYSELMDSLQQLGVHAVMAGIALPNAASVGLHEKLGFEKVAHLREVGRKFERWVDVGYWQRLLPKDEERASLLES